MSNPGVRQVLGVKSNAKDDEIKKAFRKLALQFHPDKVCGKRGHGGHALDFVIHFHLAVKNLMVEAVCWGAAGSRPPCSQTELHAFT